ncbi:MAG: TldD/PmbA family protein [Lachnospiraceae bacterium]|nr:TldD/PmbA family protein [Lachnospiraceae bacterium]
MTDIRECANLALAGLLAGGAEKASVSVYETENREFNAENGELSLLRTMIDKSLGIKAIKDQKMGTISGNDLTKEGIEKAVEDCLLAAESSAEDPFQDIGEKQESEVFRLDCYEPDMDRFFERVQEFLKDIREEFPKINVMLSVCNHYKNHNIYKNSNGTQFEVFEGRYGVMVEFSAQDGDQTTNIDGAGFSTTNLDIPFIEQSDVRRHLQQAVDQLHLVPVTGKQEGTVIFTPDCAAQICFSMIGIFCDGSSILDGTSQWKDKIGEKVVDESVTIRVDPFDERIVGGHRYTGDGYRTEPVTIIEKGVLKNHLLNLYQAKKLGRDVVKYGNGYIMEKGTTPLDDLIKGVSYGLLVGGFSGGQPNASGELSGVAKNSFLIVDGKIQGAVMETMISGNLTEMFNHVIGLSTETVEDGGTSLPYVAVGGMTISGK